MNRPAATLFAHCIWLTAVAVGCGGGTLGGGTGAGGRGGFGNNDGVGGVRGGGEFAGTSGENPCAVKPYDNPNCLAGLCGNGRLDTCTLRAAFDSCPELKTGEICDGADFGGAACTDLGYGSGTLACDGTCGLDTTGCRECVPTDATLLRCGDAPLGADHVQATIAATDTEVGLAWLEVDNADRWTIGFARFSSSLDLLSTARVQVPPGLNSNYQLVPLPSGWVVAGFGVPDVYLQPFDAMGQPLARTTVDTLPPDREFYVLALAPRPDAGPLLLWWIDGAMRAAMVAADGRSATAPATLATTDINGSNPRVTWSGNAFHVAQSVERGNNPDQLHIRRVDATGKLAGEFDALPGVSVWDPALVPGADELRVLYNGAVGTPVGGVQPRSWLLQRLDEMGNTIGGPVTVADNNYPSARGVAFGSDTGLLLGGYGLTLATARMARDGTFVTPPRTITRGDTFPASLMTEIVRRGPDAIVMWTPYPDPPRPIQLARVAM